MKKLLPLLLLPLALGCPSTTNKNPDGGTHPDGGGPSQPADSFSWAKGFSNSGGADVTAMAQDSTGVYLVGQIRGNTTFGSTTLNSDSDGRGFIAKLDANGNVLWAEAASGTESGFESIALDDSHNVFVTAYSAGNSASFTFGGSTVSGPGAVILSVDQDGMYRFEHMLTSDTAIDLGTVTVSGGMVWTAGTLTGQGDFMASNLNCTATPCVFLASFNTSGNIQSVAAAPSAPPRGNGVRNPHEVWLQPGASGGTVMAIGGYSEANIGGYSANELVLNGYNSSGMLAWTKVYNTGTATQAPLTNGFGVDASGNLYVAAEFANTLVLGGTTINSDPHAGSGAFVAKFNATGEVQWVTQSKDDDAFLPSGLGVSGSTVVAFGNGDDLLDVLPGDRTAMDLVKFDASSGAKTDVVAGVNSGRGQAVTAGTLGTFVAGNSDSNGAGTFGLLSTTTSGVFVAKIK